MELLRSGAPGSAGEELFLAIGLGALGGPIDGGLKTAAGAASVAGSRVWGDLALAAHALLESSVSWPDRDAAMNTLLPGPVRYWAVREGGPPSIDATALALHAIAYVPGQDSRPAVQWLQDRQNRDGGWAACEADCPADPSCPAVTAHVLQALCRCGIAPDSSPIARAVEFLAGAQANDGSWAPRWGGVHFIHGTSQVLCGLRAAGVDDREASVLRAGEWMRSIQNADGGWGESAASRKTGVFAESPSTAVHTGWAVSGLLAGGDGTSESVRKGVEFLLKSQAPDGGWDDAPAWTPAAGEEALVSELAGIYVPLLALADARHARQLEGR
jgi:squalene-hopene/tetraprenyl-beta-curcumene cyclase